MAQREGVEANAELGLSRMVNHLVRKGRAAARAAPGTGDHGIRARARAARGRARAARPLFRGQRGLNVKNVTGRGAPPSAR